MAYRQLFLFVEGDDDARFFQTVIVPLLGARYDNINIVRYAALKQEKLGNFVRSVQAMEADYLIVGDLDWHPCVSAAKQTLLQRCPQAKPERIQIVKWEIESWYCAGIPEDDPAWGSLSIGRMPDTESLTKEKCLHAMAAGSAPLLPTPAFPPGALRPEARCLQKRLLPVLLEPAPVRGTLNGSAVSMNRGPARREAGP